MDFSKIGTGALPGYPPGRGTGHNISPWGGGGATSRIKERKALFRDGCLQNKGQSSSEGVRTPFTPPQDPPVVQGLVAVLQSLNFSPP